MLGLRGYPTEGKKLPIQLAKTLIVSGNVSFQERAKGGKNLDSSWEIQRNLLYLDSSLKWEIFSCVG